MVLMIIILSITKNTIDATTKTLLVSNSGIAPTSRLLAGYPDAKYILTY